MFLEICLSIQRIRVRVNPHLRVISIRVPYLCMRMGDKTN